MPKKIIKKILPDHKKIKDQKALAIFGTLLHDANLWHLNRKSACGALGIGLFFAFWPVPFQMWLAAAAAIPLRVNLPLSVATVWITNPLTMVPIFSGVYLVGNTIVGGQPVDFEMELTWQWVIQSLETVGPAFLVGCLVCAVSFGIAGYLGLNLFWRYSVRKAWDKRGTRHKEKP